MWIQRTFSKRYFAQNAIMLTIANISELRARLAAWRRQAASIALVPTMGNLHAGHMSLIEYARANATRVVVSIFVNPMQFNRAEDLAAYPRTLEEDCRQLRALDTDLAFIPTVDALYPRGMENITRVEVPHLAYILEGASRPGHFAGVATIVTKLLTIVQPDMAVFGEKDYQQLLIVQRLVADLNLPGEIVGRPTVREPDGLAMSSRNGHLTAQERALAPGLHAALLDVGDHIRKGRSDYSWLERQAIHELQATGLRPDYVSIRRAYDLALPDAGDRDLVVLGAIWLGGTRLIDNIRLTLMDYR
jgi:pantoate--beta-alanine ligase